jgi:glycosyltransferase involved in cell wall biosynthesis
MLPPAAAGHPLVREGTLVYRPKTRSPERHFAALDVFLYPAVFEEFGIVVTEAQAMGIPVVVSDRVGAAETLPREYLDWGLPGHDPASFAAKCLELLNDPGLATRLAGAASASVGAWRGETYAAATAATILAQKRRLR